MKQNKVTQYLAYAFGEVFLVVVGILIALGINNWNEARKEKAIELEILTNIKTALAQDTVKLNQLNKNFLGKIDLYNEYREALKNIGNPNIEVNARFGRLSQEIRYAASTDPYRSFESLGFQIVKDKEVREAILRLYNTTYKDLESRLQNTNSNTVNFRRPLIRKYFKITVDPVRFIPYDNEAVLNSKEMFNEMSLMKGNANNTLKALNQDVIPEVKALMQQIESYIESH